MRTSGRDPALFPMEMSVMRRREDGEGTGGPSFLTRAPAALSLRSGGFPHRVPGTLLHDFVCLGCSVIGDLVTGVIFHPQVTSNL